MHIRNQRKINHNNSKHATESKKRNFGRVEGNTLMRSRRAGKNEWGEQNKRNTDTRRRRVGEREYGVLPPQNPYPGWQMSISGHGKAFGIWRGRGTEGVGGRQRKEVRLSRGGGGQGNGTWRKPSCENRPLPL